jgi:hypothetical protein
MAGEEGGLGESPKIFPQVFFIKIFVKLLVEVNCFSVREYLSSVVLYSIFLGPD